MKEGAKAAAPATLADAKAAGAVTMNLGLFVNSVISFAIVAFALFMVVKAMNKLRMEKAANRRHPPAKTARIAARTFLFRPSVVPIAPLIWAELPLRSAQPAARISGPPDTIPFCVRSETMALMGRLLLALFVLSGCSDKQPSGEITNGPEQIAETFYRALRANPLVDLPAPEQYRCFVPCYSRVYCVGWSRLMSWIGKSMLTSRNRHHRFRKAVCLLHCLRGHRF